MGLDPSVKKTNIRMSLKKFINDGLPEDLPVFYDRGFFPAVDASTQWCSVLFRGMNRGGLSDFTVDLVGATRQDPDGDRLAAVADQLFGLMTDPPVKNTAGQILSGSVDGKRRIPLFDVSVSPWTAIGTLLVTGIADSDEMTAADNTKYQILSCRLRWVAKA